MNTHSPSTELPTGAAGIGRRSLLKGAAWSVPLVSAAAITPVAAATTTPIVGAVAVTVSEPAYDGVPGSTPIFSGTGSKSWSRAWLPPSLQFTNIGNARIDSWTGQLQIQLQNQDTTRNLAYRLQATSQAPEIVLRDITSDFNTWAPRIYSFVGSRSLGPNETFVVPLRYFVPSLFTNPAFTVIVDATVSGAWGTSTSARLGYSEGFGSLDMS